MELPTLKRGGLHRLEFLCLNLRVIKEEEKLDMRGHDEFGETNDYAKRMDEEIESSK